MSKERFNAQRFLQMAGEEGIINLDLSLKQLATSKAADYFSQVADDGDYVICPDFIFWRGPRPHFEDILQRRDLVNSLQESLNLNKQLLGKMGGLGG